MKTLDQRLSDLLLDLYESAANPEHWARFLENAARELDAAKAALHIHYFVPQDSIRTARGSCAVAIGYDASSLDTYASYYATQDIYVQRVRERFPLGINAGTSEDLVTASELRNTEIYHDYCRTNEVFHTCWSAFEQAQGIAAGLGFIRPESARPFEADDVELLKMLNPHLSKAFRLQRLVASATEDRNALLTSIAEFDFGVIALDCEGRITNISKPAKLLLDEQDGIRIRASRLEAVQPSENQKLQGMLAIASQVCDNPHQPFGNALLLTRRSGKRPLRLVAYPFASGGLFTEDKPRVLVFLSDPSSRPASRGAVLRDLYGLTPTESRLADLLLHGLEVREVADQMRTTLETARFHLKRVLAKTGTHRQTELMRLMLSLPGAPSPGLLG